MNQFHNKHLRQTCFILGNGPSLNVAPFHLIANYHSFGTNRIYLKYIPDYYVCVNPLVIAQNIEDITKLDRCYKFIPKKFKNASFRLDNSFIGLNCIPKREFSTSPHIWIYEGYTVTFVCLQLAYYMGFETVLLVGMDHRYIYQGNPNEVSKMTTDDPNHFDKNYFKNQIWNNPDLERSEEAYKMARIQFEKDGRRIINLTPNSSLNVFEKADVRKMEEALDDW